MRKPIIRKTLLESKRENDAAIKSWGAVFGKEVKPEMLSGVAPKKTRIRSSAASASSEHKEQCKVINWWNKWCGTFNAPRFALFAIPNGGMRDMLAAVKLKREGVRSGVYDLFLAMPRNGQHGFWVEMKYGKGRTSEEQDEFGAFVKSQGYATAVCWTGEAAIEEIKGYFGLPSQN